MFYTDKGLIFFFFPLTSSLVKAELFLLKLFKKRKFISVESWIE